MKKVSLLCVALLTFTLSVAHSNFGSKASLNQETNEVTATITKNTTEEQFTELIAYFKENEITLNLTEVNYNEQDEIISIHISLEKDGQNSNYGLSSNLPIADIHLGYKNNRLFIKSNKGLQTSNHSLSSLFEQLNGNHSIDSLLTANPFSFSFSSADLKDFMNSSSIHFDFDDLGDLFGQTNDTNSPSSKSAHKSGLPKYNFINTPGIQKLIMVDGKESNFKTLDRLAKNDQLDEVDNLKPTTAISLYGKKAKDGAIIATTKK